ncbi:MAG: hypothetical protein ABSF67_12725 [Roseiarcus sp.]|jgi:hypothetical protein
MNLEFDIGARRAKAAHFGDDDRLVVGARLSSETRGATASALCKRNRRIATFRLEAARAAAFTASSARWRRLAPFAKEISQ